MRAMIRKPIRQLRRGLALALPLLFGTLAAAASAAGADLPPLQAAPGVTALSGQVLTLQDQPLANVTLQLGQAAATTDSTGRFVLAPAAPGQAPLVIDGRKAGPAGNANYGLFEALVNAAAGRTTVLPFTIWLPRIDTAHAVRIPSPTTKEVVVTTPLIPGLEVHIPPQTVIVDHDGNPATEVSITPIPVDRPPFPLAKNVYVPIYYTIQPGGAYVKNLDPAYQGVRIVYPNYQKEIAGVRASFWRYDPDQLGWVVYGAGTVGADRKQVVPDPGTVVYAFTGAMINSGLTPPTIGPPPNPNDGSNGSGGEPVDLATGLFVHQHTDLVVPDTLPLVLTRTYRQQDANTRAFGVGTNFPYGIFLWSAQQYQQADLVLPDGGRVHYVRISSGTSFNDAIFQTTSNPGPFYNSQIVWNGNGWNLTLKDGTIYVFGENAPLQAIRDRYGNTITLTRTSGQSGNITQVSSPNGRSIAFTYDTSNRVTQAKDNFGRTVGYTYDGSGRLSTVTDADGGITTYTYDASNNMLTIKDPRLNVYLTNAYDTNNRVKTQTQADTTAFQFAYTLDANGNVTQTNVTDPRGFVRVMTFDAAHYPTSDTLASGTAQQQVFNYTRQANTELLLSVTDPLSRQTAYTYDAVGNITSITRLAGTPQAVTTTYTYSQPFNRLASVTDPLSHTTTLTYDNLGNLTQVADPLNHATSLTYDPFGRVLTVTDALNHTTQFTYDLANVATITDPLSRTVTRYTDALGRMVSLADPLGNKIHFAYDSLNGLSQATDATGAVKSIAYDADGNAASITDPRNGVTSYTYDAMDRLASRTDPLLKVESYPQYDGNGNLLHFSDRKSQATSYTYDPLNRLSTVTFADSSTITYTNDAGNRLTQAVDSISGTMTWGYDGLDRLTSETTPQGQVTYTYDNAGRRTGMTVSGQAAITYSYDNANRLTQIQQGTATVTLAYDNANRLTSLTLPNSVVATYAYDNASQVTGITYTLGSTTLGNLTYAYDTAGRRINVGGSLASVNLPAAIASASYDADNRLTQWGSISPTYDLNGNLTNDGSRAYTWDARNRVTVISGTASFAYDTFGRRQSKTIGSTTTAFLYDGLNPVQELSGSTPTANLVTGLGVDQMFTRTTSAGARHFLTDGLNSTLALTDGTGALQTQYAYEPFGNTNTSGGANDNSYQYTGRENDGIGLYYYRARYYNPVWQRFISEDPIELRGGVNLYTYVGDSPVIFVDPLGLFCLPPAARNILIGALSGAAGGAVNGLLTGGLTGAGAGLVVGLTFGAVSGYYDIQGGILGGVLGAGAGAIGVQVVDRSAAIVVSKGAVIGGAAGGALGGTPGGAIGGLIAGFIDAPANTFLARAVSGLKAGSAGLAGGIVTDGASIGLSALIPVCPQLCSQ